MELRGGRLMDLSSPEVRATQYMVATKEEDSTHEMGQSWACEDLDGDARTERDRSVVCDLVDTVVEGR